MVRLSDVLQIVLRRSYEAATYGAGMAALNLMPVAIVADLCKALSVAPPEALEELVGKKKKIGPLADKASSLIHLLVAEHGRGPSHISSGSAILAEAKDLLARNLQLRRGLPNLSAMTTALTSAYEACGQSFRLPQLARERAEIKGNYPFPKTPASKSDLAAQDLPGLQHAYVTLIREQFLPVHLDRETALPLLSAVRGKSMLGLSTKPFVHGLMVASAVYAYSSVSVDRLPQVWPVLWDMDSSTGLLRGPWRMTLAECARRWTFPKAGGSYGFHQDLEIIRKDRRFFTFYTALMKSEYGARKLPLAYGMEEFVKWVSRGALAPYPKTPSPKAAAQLQGGTHVVDLTLGAPASIPPSAVTATSKKVCSSAVESIPKGICSGTVIATSKEVSSVSPVPRSVRAASKEARSGRSVRAASKEARSGRDTRTRTRSPERRAYHTRSPARRQRDRRSRSRSRDYSRSRVRSRSRSRRSSRRSDRIRSRSSQRERRHRSSSRRRSRDRRSRDGSFSRARGSRSSSRVRPPTPSSTSGHPAPAPQLPPALPPTVSPQLPPAVLSIPPPQMHPAPPAPPSPSPVPIPSSAPSPATTPILADLQKMMATMAELSKRVSSVEATKTGQKRKMMEEILEIKTEVSPALVDQVNQEADAEEGERDESIDVEMAVSSDEDQGEGLDSPVEEPMILSRAPPPLPPQMTEELTLGRVGSFVVQEVGNRLYTKTWKVPPSLLVAASEEKPPKEQQWTTPAKELDPLKLVQAFNKAEKVSSHTRFTPDFGSATLTAQLKSSSLLSKQEKEFLATGLDIEQARDTELLWRAVRTHQEAKLCEARMHAMTDIIDALQRDHPDVWTQLMEQQAVDNPKEELDTSLAEQQAERVSEITGNTVALFLETLKQGYRKVHLLSAKALGATADALGSCRPTTGISVCTQRLLVEAQAKAALPNIGPSQSGTFFRGSASAGQRSPSRRGAARGGSSQGGAARGGSARPKNRRKLKRTGRKPNAQTAQPPPYSGAAQSGRPRQDRKPAAPKKKQEGGQQKKQKRE